MKLTEFFDNNRDLQAWQAGFSHTYRTLLTGISGTAKSLVLANAYENNPDKYVIITDSQYNAGELHSELSELIGTEHVYQYFSDDTVYAEFAFASKDRIAYRLEALNFLLEPEKKGFLVVPWLAMRSFLSPVKQFTDAKIRLTKGEEIELYSLVHQLSISGYERQDRVMTPGEFSVRGDIVDIYPLNAENPVRIEFFGDEVDQIRVFDAETQRSLPHEILTADTEALTRNVQRADQLEILPVSELILTDEDYDRANEAFSVALSRMAAAKGQESESESVSITEEKASYLEEILAVSREYLPHKDSRKFVEFFYENSATLWDYLPANCHLFVDDFSKINEANNKTTTDLADFQLSEITMNRHIEGQSYLADTMQQLRHYRPSTFISNFQKGLGNLRFDALYPFQQHSMQQFFGQLELLYTELDRFVKQKFTVVLAVSHTKNLSELTDLELPIIRTTREDLQVDRVNVTPLQLSNGFVWLDQKLVVITESEIFGKARRKRARHLNITNAERLKNYNELEIGDYVVHKTHGIGKYLGIQTIEIDGQHRDYLTIEYQNGDTISIPIDHLDALTKYTAGEGKIPRINRLNDGRWRRTLTSVSRQVEDISEDLIKLYAARQAQKGFAFSPDDGNQEEFDDAFAYAETPDQLRSVAEVKQDMERTLPMDRLLVGDVGFGKTEVAMRAAFKAINDHKQVAILVPTTVLAEQHYQTMTERFVDFGVNVAVLSRFQTKTEQTQILAKLKKGQVDLIIGTHRLLSQDIIFNDLGFIVIDEEQRFGVKHKERLKELKNQVDVLTLTATPIPRTLHMSMLGIRDLSVIETPPTNRYPVQTYIMETNYGVIRDAVLREMGRGGQAFYVFNRVDGIENKVAQLEELIPEARIAAVHGQMTESQLENTLLDFIAGEYDLLVTTTIIETGVDIPNVNTLFVEHADRFGLSQLYQLRGRVGRTNRVAYAYLMYQPDKVLTEVADKRLEAIKGFTELGSGFKIAMQDLSIRGAGNLLGAEQSGFIDSIGFELYSQLLSEAIQKGIGKKETKLITHAELILNVDAFLPTAYITDERQKIEIYKRIQQLNSRKAYTELKEELVDRFGGYPKEVAYLLEIGLLKFFADTALVDKIEVTPREIVLTLSKTSQAIYQPTHYFEALAATVLKANLAEEKGVMVFRFKAEKTAIYWLQELVIFCEKLAHIRERSSQ